MIRKARLLQQQFQAACNHQERTRFASVPSPHALGQLLLALHKRCERVSQHVFVQVPPDKHQSVGALLASFPLRGGLHVKRLVPAVLA